jgi:hypothetical protein
MDLCFPHCGSKRTCLYQRDSISGCWCCGLHPSVSLSTASCCFGCIGLCRVLSTQQTTHVWSHAKRCCTAVMSHGGDAAMSVCTTCQHVCVYSYYVVRPYLRVVRTLQPCSHPFIWFQTKFKYMCGVYSGLHCRQLQLPALAPITASSVVRFKCPFWKQFQEAKLEHDQPEPYIPQAYACLGRSVCQGLL